MADDRGVITSHSQILREGRNVQTNHLLQAAHTLARQQPRDVAVIANALVKHGSNAHAPGLSHEAIVFLNALLDLAESDSQYQALGQAMQNPHTVQRYAEMDVAGRARDLDGLPPLDVLLDLITFQQIELAELAPRTEEVIRQEVTAATERLEKHTTYDDAREVAVKPPVRRSFFVILFTFVLLLLGIAYIVARIADIADLQSYESKTGYTVYRAVVLVVEIFYALAAVYLLLSRTQRRVDLTFASDVSAQNAFSPVEILTILMCTDEDKFAIISAVESHYQARRPQGLPIKVVVVLEQETHEAKEAIIHLRKHFKGVSFMSYEQLANQAIVIDPNAHTGQLGDNAVEGVIVADTMSSGQALYFALHALTRTHNTRKSAVCVMDASCRVDLDRYYDYAVRALSQSGVNAVNTPIRATNLPAIGDFFDMARNRDKWCRLPGLLADEKRALNPKCFMARGYYIYRVLRTAEARNMKTHNLDWLMYLTAAKHTAAISVYDPVHGPVSTYLGHVNGLYIVQDTITETLESLDVASVFGREAGGCFACGLCRLFSAPHLAAISAVCLELTILIVGLIVVFGKITPSSSDDVALGVLFLAYYLFVALSAMVTPYGFKFSLLGAVLTNRVMAPVHWALYLANMSRFGVDRRGHFQSIGETTTAQLVDARKHQPRMRMEAETTVLGEADERALEEDVVIEIDADSPRALALVAPSGGPVAEGAEHAAYHNPGRSNLAPRTLKHRRLIALASSTALVVIGVALLIFIRGWVVLQHNPPKNYTTVELVAARSWVVASMAFAIFVMVPSVILVVTLSQGNAYVRNRPVATLLVILSLAGLILPGLMQFLSYAVLNHRDGLLDLPALATASNQFMASQASGDAASLSKLTDLPPWRSPSGTADGNPGGWYTGPGFARFTYPQAIVVTDLAMALLAFPNELKAMNAYNGVQSQLEHGFNYLASVYTGNAIASHLFDFQGTGTPSISNGNSIRYYNIDVEWQRPEDTRSGSPASLTLDATNPGTETFAAACAAFAAYAIFLQAANPSSAQLPGAKNSAASLYELAKGSLQSYTYVYPDVIPLWPSNPQALHDDLLWAAAWMSYLNPDDDTIKNDIEGFYTNAQRERTQLGIDDASMNIDDYWWPANVLLAHVQSSVSRYSSAVDDFVSAWVHQNSELAASTSSASGALSRQKITSVDDGLAYMRPSFWTATEIDSLLPKLYLTPGPTGFNVRASALILWYTANQDSESQSDRDGVCFAQSQLRHLLGVNANSISYVVGLNQYSASRRVSHPYERASSCPTDPTAVCSSADLLTTNPNPSVLVGALVHGMDAAGRFYDVRSTDVSNSFYLQYTGVSVLNNSPLPMLAAGLHARGLGIKDCIGYEKKGLATSRVSSAQ